MSPTLTKPSQRQRLRGDNSNAAQETAGRLLKSYVQSLPHLRINCQIYSI